MIYRYGGFLHTSQQEVYHAKKAVIPLIAAAIMSIASAAFPAAASEAESDYDEALYPEIRADEHIIADGILTLLDTGLLLKRITD